MKRNFAVTRPQIVLIGLSGNTREIFESVQAQFDIAAILSDDPAHGPAFEGIPVSPLSRAHDYGEAQFLFLIGSQSSYRQRAALIARLGLAPERYARIIHPRATVSRFAQLGAGVVLHCGVTVTSNAVLGAHVMVLPHSVIHHDVRVGDYSLIGSNVTIAGSVEIGESCYIASACSIRNGVRIGDGALIGMGANVLNDVAPGAVMVGNPAREIPRRS
jgi:sugar O-acyltransferase (sialic acid O-acetyltransferase NeuD family)